MQTALTSRVRSRGIKASLKGVFVTQYGQKLNMSAERREFQFPKSNCFKRMKHQQRLNFSHLSLETSLNMVWSSSQKDDDQCIKYFKAVKVGLPTDLHQILHPFLHSFNYFSHTSVDSLIHLFPIPSFYSFLVVGCGCQKHNFLFLSRYLSTHSACKYFMYFFHCSESL